MKFYLDECINPEIAVHARRLGVDVTEWRTEGLQGRTDEDQLRHAAKKGRCLVTSNCLHFKRHTRRFEAAAEPHAGVLCLKPARFDMSNADAIAELLAKFAEAHPDGLRQYEVIADSFVIRGIKR